MNITELRYLVAIMKWGSVSAAAKQMYAAQPNVSKALKNLEEEYGIRMFERSSTGMIPTEQGRAQSVCDRVFHLRKGVDKNINYAPFFCMKKIFTLLLIASISTSAILAEIGRAHV